MRKGAVPMMNHEAELVYAGVDTHTDTHHVAVIGAHGRELGDVQVPATAAGYRQALAFLARWPDGVEVGVECTGSYGAALTRELRAAGYAVIEVNRPNRFDRRAHGKTDTFDAYSAAEAVMTGRAHSAPKGADGLVEALRALRTTRSSALRERTATINQIKAMLIAGPEQLRSRYRGLSNIRLTAALAASRPSARPVSAEEATAYALRTLARRHQLLTEQITDLTGHLRRLLDDHAPQLMGLSCPAPNTPISCGACSAPGRTPSPSC